MNLRHKFIFSAMLAGLVLGGTSSCDDGFLDREPLHAISGESFWKTQADVDMALVGVYRRLQSNLFGHRRTHLDGYSDNSYDRHQQIGFQNLTIGITNPSNVPSALYNDPYAGIAACNYFLENVGSVTALPPATAGIYIAEVRFLRALFYFELVQFFGDVVLYKTPPKTAEDAKIAKSPKADVLAFIVEDLDDAISKLPATAYSGHAVKASAQMLKARVRLYQQNWADAVALTSDIMGTNTFSIFQGGYANLFLQPTQQGNPEIIFSTKYLAPNNPQGNEGMLVEIGWYGGNQPYQNLVDEYETASGKMITDASSGYDPANPYDKRDPRLKMTILVPGDKYVNPDGSTFATSDPILTGFAQKKYMDVSKLPWDRSKITVTDMNIVHMRYAEVLLAYAEAKNEVSGPDASIYDALNKIRSRTGVNLPPVSQTMYNTKEKLRDFIRHERRVELAMEGHRYFDLKRWGIIAQKLATVKNPAGVTLSFGEKNNVLPFPQSEIDRNKSLVQNTGY
ncbi:RagB/SusD family nutrient uptake outer membrane protein [Dyadobacter aurulentus]|uniref:RagB/SusD family nutrient uptake outer membrane protein n=1 Tax=Dyadobacter sp. UC 10 TaxID=2605428 RepID=UPI0011F20724|nr:RagB/SusD family nutrient uptake outer membrane protein [Dyadobacter sp. UC 10]KAA0988795.1 RagB/SusD family nutrient uptake outer membrane protein [Dyadobacter sp. UC 10]